MRLKEMLVGLEGLKAKGNLDIDIKGIAFNSKEIKEGYVFVAIKGFETDGHNYINEAIELGASAIIIEEGCNLKEIKITDNITIVMVTHDPYIASFSSRVIMIRDGLLDTTIENKDHNQTRFYNSILKESARQTIFKDEESALSIDDYEELLNENKRLKKKIIELEYKEKLNSI